MGLVKTLFVLIEFLVIYWTTLMILGIHLNEFQMLFVLIISLALMDDD